MSQLINPDRKRHEALIIHVFDFEGPPPIDYNQSGPTINSTHVISDFT